MKIRADIQRIEKEYPVNTYKYNQIHYWLAIKGHFFTKKFYQPNSEVKLDFKAKINLFLSIRVGLFNWFRLKKFDFWFFTDSLERRLIQNTYTDKLVDYPASILLNSLIIETPIFNLEKKVFSKYRVSKIMLILFEQLYIKLFLYKDNNIDIKLNELLKQEKIAVDVDFYAKKMQAQYKIMDLLLKIKKPKAVFFVNSYSNYGYIKALKEKNVKVIEFQHGVINKHHYGYNVFTDFDNSYFPDYLLSFGLKEKDIFIDDNKWINKNKVIPIGSYLIDFVNNNILLEERIVSLKKGYKKTIAVSLQDCEIGKKFMLFLINVANKNNTILYLLNPRKTSANEYLKQYTIPGNMMFMDKLNIYETIKHADFHTTAYSSCVLEAPALGVKNIVVNIENRAKEYYEDIFLDSQNIIFTEYEDVYIKEVLNQTVTDRNTVQENHKNIISPDYKNNISNFLNNHIL